MQALQYLKEFYLSNCFLINSMKRIQENYLLYLLEFHLNTNCLRDQCFLRAKTQYSSTLVQHLSTWRMHSSHMIGSNICKILIKYSQPLKKIFWVIEVKILKHFGILPDSFFNGRSKSFFKKNDRSKSWIFFRWQSSNGSKLPKLFFPNLKLATFVICFTVGFT